VGFWSALQGPLILYENAKRFENISDMFDVVQSNLKEGLPTAVRALLCDVGTKNRQVHHPVTTHTRGKSLDDSLCGAVAFGSKCKPNPNVRMFATWTKHGNNAIETARDVLHPIMASYVGLEEMSHSHQTPSWERVRKHKSKDKSLHLEDSGESI